LLTGRTPFATKELLEQGLDGLRRTLQERDPKRPSAIVTTLQGPALTQVAQNRRAEPLKLVSLLRGDLDWIVIRALEKDRARRYETANGLAMDAERYLNNEPVLARPPTRFYRLRKLVRRHRVACAAGTAVAVALIGGLGVSTWFWHEESQSRKRAVAAEQQAMTAEREQRRLRLEAEDRERITEAAFLITQNKLQDADDLVGKVSVVRPSLETESVLRTLGEWHALKGQWAQAAERYNLLLEADRRDNSWAITDDLLQAGPILIERGDIKGYERFRQAAVARYLDTKDPVFAERTLKISLLRPADGQLMQSLEHLSEISADSMDYPGQDPIMVGWRCVSLALMAYRQDYTPTAKDWCRRCLASPNYIPARVATAHIIQAMSSCRLGEMKVARAELARGRQLVDAEFAKGLEMGNGATGFWYDWLFARILLREADALFADQAASGK
jgi:hypothetical protein